MMKTTLQLRASQQFQLTPQLQQSLKFLQLSSLELEETIHQLLNDNPFLTTDTENGAINDLSTEKNTPEYDNTPLSLNEGPLIESEPPSEETFALYDSFEQGITHELATDSEWSDYYQSDDSLQQDSNHFLNSSSESDHHFLDNHSEHLSLKDDLLKQVNLSHFTPCEKMIAYYIIDALDEEGYLVQSKEDLINALQEEEKHLPELGLSFKDNFNSVLLRIQRFDPIGLATWSLQERLLVQLDTYPESKEKKLAKVLLSQYSEMLGKRQFKEIAKSAKLEELDIKNALDFLSQLDPFPARRFTSQKQTLTLPDVIVKNNNKNLEISINNQAIPQIRLDKNYVKMLQNSKKSSKEYTQEAQNPLQYLQKAYDEAKNVLMSIDNRHKTLLVVANQIIAYQLDFFISDDGKLKPMTLSDIASTLEMSESTISRACQNKTLICDKGIFELKHFFQSHVKNEDGDAVSADKIKSLIAHWIENENKTKPLSDSKIEALLNQQGIIVARRTVAKYREQLGYASSNLRKML